MQRDALPDDPLTLDVLEARLRRELPYLDYPKRAWTLPRSRDGVHIHDVVIVGGGQSGLAVAYGLRRERIEDVVVLDRSPAGLEGPWLTFARMTTLRTPKMGSGLDFGNPLLTPQAWYTAQFGEAAWNALGKMPRELWQAYLLWYRRVLGLEVRSGIEVTSVHPDGDAIAVATRAAGTLLARKVVLATGLDGGGRWVVPPVADALPAHCFGHTESAIDFPSLAGKRVGVLGAGASAFDNAAMALEHGAARVDLCLRIAAFPRINPYKWIEFSGFLGAYYTLPDAKRWRFMRQVARMNQPPPQETMWRCTRHANFAIHTDAQWLAARHDTRAITVETRHRTFEFDYLIFATGIKNDLASRPELARIAPEVALWRDRFTPSAGDEDESLAAAPYLGPGFEFTERVPGRAPWLANIHAYHYGATLSMGLSAASITGMKYGIRRIVDGVARGLFLDDADALYDQLCGYDEHEIQRFDPPPEMLAAKG